MLGSRQSFWRVARKGKEAITIPDHSFRSVLVFCAAGIALRIMTSALPQIARDLAMLVGVTLFVILGYGLAAAVMHTTRL